MTVQRLSYFLFCFVCLNLCQQGLAQGKSSFVWNVQPNSSIVIHGSSNVNTFGCASSGSFRSQPIEGAVAQGKVNLKGSIAIGINQLDCKNRMLNRDLRNTLKADQYPTLTIHFVSLDKIPQSGINKETITGTVLIELAGKRKTFNLKYVLTRTKDGLLLEGGRAFSFSDFELSPPHKVGGLIKVRDNFDVKFTLCLAEG